MRLPEIIEDVSEEVYMSFATYFQVYGGFQYQLYQLPSLLFYSYGQTSDPSWCDPAKLPAGVVFCVK